MNGAKAAVAGLVAALVLAGCATHRKSPPPMTARPAVIQSRSVAEIYDKRPRAWCGWWLRKQMITDPGPAANRARWWMDYGAPAPGPMTGAIVVFPRGRVGGHVGIIVGDCANGQRLVRSGNDGHAVRTRCRSISTAIAFRWPR